MSIGEYVINQLWLLKKSRKKPTTKAGWAAAVDKMVAVYRIVDAAPVAKNITGVTVDDIYKAYPRKVGKANAIKAIAKSMMSVPHEDLLESVKKYAKATALWPEEQRKFIPHCSTWMNQGRWEDDPSEWERKSDEQRAEQKRSADKNNADYTIF
ncbi:MAG: hypothetical protein Unbinned1322contig1001_24 [Prokaryotic dsDNA virus sp.]|nr:MAG: hypothetical protein Unbinned1322contig1001_24 [Prokaryotic dsDNA virus sp.]|tara:strand:+ start:27262 stop:27723 length:462 start_codon:yes stop_codon:yes gene_type:complete